MYFLHFKANGGDDHFQSFLTRMINKLSSKSLVAAQYDLKLNAIEEVQSSLKLKNVYAGQWELEIFLNTTYIIDTFLSAANRCRFSTHHEKE